MRSNGTAMWLGVLISIVLALCFMSAVSASALQGITVKRIPFSSSNEANGYVPVFVMLPLDAVSNSSVNNPDQLLSRLYQLKNAGVDGVMTDVWWGIAESPGPKSYNWGPYQQLVKLVQQAGLKLQVVMSFHQCGGNVGDSCNIPLPWWVRQVGNSNPDIFFTDREGNRDIEYLSFGVDHQPLFGGRTAIQMYSDYMQSFHDTFSSFLGSTITEVQVGLGPCGEMRYPSYQLAHWNFPGVGEFQMYDQYLLAQLLNAATAAGHSEWGHGGPSNAGQYNDYPYNTGFFSDNGGDNWSSAYGQFFLNWYSSTLLQHGNDVLGAAQNIFGNTQGLKIAAKVAGIHWWYKTNSHAAELTAGYYNTNSRDGYTPIAQMFKKYGATFDFTCLEMLDQNQGSTCQCGPQELVSQTEQAAYNTGIEYSGENALQVYDYNSYKQIESQASANGRLISAFTYLRMCDTLFNNFSAFQQFVQQMHNL